MVQYLAKKSDYAYADSKGPDQPVLLCCLVTESFDAIVYS